MLQNFETNDDLCVLPSQYRKFVWFFIDSLAFDESEAIRNIFQTHSNTYK
jgi:hypothetical protein